MAFNSQSGDVATRSTIDSFLRTPPNGVRPAPPELWGFGGLHGGLAIAAMVDAMAASAEPTGQTGAGAQRLRSVTGRLHRAVREPFSVAAQTDAATRSTRSASARLFPSADEQPAAQTAPVAPLASATSLFGSDSPAPAPAFAPPFPDVPAWHAGGLFNPPPSFVPVSEFYELRVTGTNRPFAGGTDPSLTAWVRLTEDDQPPGQLRLLFLVDALAPSISAVLDTPQPVPTIELSVQFSGNRAVSPWVLVDARTAASGPDGWVTETIQVWGEDRAHLASATQLRLVRPLPAP
ncbi:hypothetical protein ACFSWE_02785 [Leucobacter albus]|uniref:Acyl-CoA thioesterase-like C-terminal domain-containing protein n=1 Tax=Leucobacter albus TaxID=272210 RepID=A0ABW3TNN9_9MICO